VTDYTILPVTRPTRRWLELDSCEEAMPGQEGVTCWLRESHAGPHETIASPPCANCGGLEMHRVECPTPEASAPVSADIIVQWEQRSGGPALRAVEQAP
jgi:hypothetical protein